MAIDSPEGDVEFIRYLFAQFACATCLDDFQFTFGKKCRGAFVEFGICYIAHQYRNVATVERHFLRDGVDGEPYFLQGSVLADKTVNTNSHELGDDILFGIYGKDDDFNIRILGSHAFSDLETVRAGHKDVQ